MDKERIVKNESLLRQINEGIAGAAAEHGRGDSQLPYVCECPVLECGRILHLTLAKYQAVRQHPARFLVANGHEVEGVEEVVERQARYLVVKKIGEAK